MGTAEEMSSDFCHSTRHIEAASSFCNWKPLRGRSHQERKTNNLKCSCLVVVVQQYLNILIRSTACSALLRPKVKRQLRPRGAQDMMEQMGEEVSRCVRRSRRVQPRQKKNMGWLPTRLPQSISCRARLAGQQAALGKVKAVAFYRFTFFFFHQLLEIQVKSSPKLLMSHFC